MELSKFLLARIAEDEAVAMEANWRFAEHDAPEQVAPHIARHDPARVLAECDAKRRIVDMVVAADDPVSDFDPDYWAGLGVAEKALQLLALSYADHPDYDEAWRP